MNLRLPIAGKMLIFVEDGYKISFEYYKTNWNKCILNTDAIWSIYFWKLILERKCKHKFAVNVGFAQWNCNLTTIRFEKNIIFDYYIMYMFKMNTIKIKSYQQLCPRQRRSYNLFYTYEHTCCTYFVIIIFD